MPDNDPVKTLIRRCAIEAIERVPKVISGIASSGGETAQLAEVLQDPELWDAFVRTTHSNVTVWLEANIASPGEAVEPNRDPQLLVFARSLVLRGLLRSAFDAYRIGQLVSWRLWMQVVFELATDMEIAQRALEITARTTQEYVDATIALTDVDYMATLDVPEIDAQAERREAASLVISGQFDATARVESKLAYRMAHKHTALIVWSDHPDPDPAAMSAFITRLCTQWSAAQSLTISASTGTQWVWVEAEPQPLNDHDVPPEFRITIGSYREGAEGFRRSHLEALETQRMLARLGSTRRAASIIDTELTNLVTKDAGAVDAFVKERLGDLAAAPEEIRSTLRAYLRARNSVSQTAVALHAHRNTIVRRIARAEELLPRRLDEDPLGIGVALDVLYWRG